MQRQRCERGRTTAYARAASSVSTWCCVALFLVCYCGSVPAVSSFTVGTPTARRKTTALGVDGDGAPKIVVALTREDGKNDKLRAALLRHPRLPSDTVSIIELPCIAHADGPDAGAPFHAVLSQERFDYVAITSPEAARVFAAAWQEVATTTTTTTPPAVCAVGTATAEALRACGLDVTFVPGKATAKTLAAELPSRTEAGDVTRVLYPASRQAADTLQRGLEARTDAAFAVTRLDTYDTVPAVWSRGEEAALLPSGATVVACFASPSAVAAWCHNTDRNCLAACIGETSARACREAGWEDVLHPAKPGLVGWADSVADAVERSSR